MRNLFIPLAAAASALAVASPAAAQWGAPQGHAYGYGQNNHGQVRALQVQVLQLRQTIHQLDRRNRLSNSEARRLDRHAITLLQRIQGAGYRGLNRREFADIQRRIQGLRQAIRYQARDGGRWGWNGHDSYNNGYGYYGARARDGDRRGYRDDDDRRGNRGDRDDNDRRGDRDDDDRRDGRGGRDRD